jgi:hypothetical protein
MNSIDTRGRRGDRDAAIRFRADGEPAATDDTGDATTGPEPDGDRPKRPRTPRDPEGTDQATMWPDPWAGHRH